MKKIAIIGSGFSGISAAAYAAKDGFEVHVFEKHKQPGGTIDKYYKWNVLSGFNNILVFVSVIVLSLVALLNIDKIYTLVTSIVTITTLIYLHFIARSEWITKASVVFTILMLGFFPVNGILTGSYIENPIVNYNPTDFLGIRMFTIPIEDAVYGYSQFLLVLYFFKQFQKIK